MSAAAEVIAEWVNRSPDLLPNHELRVISSDGECDGPAEQLTIHRALFNRRIDVWPSSEELEKSLIPEWGRKFGFDPTSEATQALYGDKNTQPPSSWQVTEEVAQNSSWPKTYWPELGFQMMVGPGCSSGVRLTHDTLSGAQVPYVVASSISADLYNLPNYYRVGASSQHQIQATLKLLDLVAVPALSGSDAGKVNVAMVEDQTYVIGGMLEAQNRFLQTLKLDKKIRFLGNDVRTAVSAKTGQKATGHVITSTDAKTITREITAICSELVTPDENGRVARLIWARANPTSMDNNIVELLCTCYRMGMRKSRFIFPKASEFTVALEDMVAAYKNPRNPDAKECTGEEMTYMWEWSLLIEAGRLLKDDVTQLTCSPKSEKITAQTFVLESAKKLLPTQLPQNPPPTRR